MVPSRQVCGDDAVTRHVIHRRLGASEMVRDQSAAREKAARCPGERPSQSRRLAILRVVRRVGVGDRLRTMMENQVIRERSLVDKVDFCVT